MVMNRVRKSSIDAELENDHNAARSSIWMSRAGHELASGTGTLCDSVLDNNTIIRETDKKFKTFSTFLLYIGNF